jgi:uncharacterized protein YecT (DUF1311 family)
MSDSPSSNHRLGFPLLPSTDVKIIRRMRIFSLLRPVAVLCITAGITAGLFAQNAAPANQADNDCQDAATTSAMRACENTRYDAAQRELNSAYQSLLQHLEYSQKQKLRAAQRAWLHFRDTNAEFQASLAQGGTLAPLIKIGTLTEMTQARASELKKATLP